MIVSSMSSITEMLNSVNLSCSGYLYVACVHSPRLYIFYISTLGKYVETPKLELPIIKQH